MDPHSFIARAEAQRWLGIAEKLLMGHDIVGAKTFAIRARESDPRLEAVDQILAIADTLLAAEKRVVGSNGTEQPDYYAILQLLRFVQDTDHIADQYRRLAVALNPHQNRFPYSDHAFQLVNDAWAVLSNPLRKSMYDGELDFPQEQEMNLIGFNLEHQHQHQHQHQHNFFSINRMGSGREQELVEQQQSFQTRVQRSHQQHNFLSPPVSEQEHLFQQRDQDELFQPQVQPFQITSTPEQQSRPPPQPFQPQTAMQSSTPPPPAASPQPPMSWPQAPPHSQPQRSTTPPRPPPPPPPVASPPPPVSWPQKPPHLQPQPRIRSSTPPPPPAPPQPQSASWQQGPPHSMPQPSHQQPQQHQHLHPPPPPQPQPELEPQRQTPPQLEEQHQQQQQESPEQNATPVQPPTQINTNNGVNEVEKERVIEADSENVDASPTFWTACPYCLYMYEYPRVYADCTLRCSNCERAFQAVPVPSPPPIIEDQEAYFCCWGSFPLGLSISHLETNNRKCTNKNWTSISPLYDVSDQVHDHLNSTPAKQNRNRGPRIYKDDDTDDIFNNGISEPSDDSDLDWNSTKNKKGKKKKKRGRKRKAKGVAGKTRKKRNKNLQNSTTENSKTPLVSNPRRQSGRVAKEMGKLDLNVEFNNNEGEEPTLKNSGHGEGEEENIEGNGFFEGLDEFLSSLPILSVVNEEKVKAS